MFGIGRWLWPGKSLLLDYYHSACTLHTSLMDIVVQTFPSSVSGAPTMHQQFGIITCKITSKNGTLMFHSRIMKICGRLAMLRNSCWRRYGIIVTSRKHPKNPRSWQSLPFSYLKHIAHGSLCGLCFSKYSFIESYNWTWNSNPTWDNEQAMPTSESETNTDDEDPPATPECQVSWRTRQFRVDSESSTGKNKSGSAAAEQPISYEGPTACGDNAIEASANLDIHRYSTGASGE